MVKFCIRKSSGEALVGLGLTAENMENLEQGKPILVDFQGLEIPPNCPISKIHLVVMYGATEEAITDQIRDSIGPDTELREKRKTPSA